ncbi:MAG: DUF6056 family protein [Muribaculaceae bacterium]
MKERIFNIWLIVVAVLYAVIFELTPWGFDDYTYMFGTVGCSTPGEVTAGIWHNVVNHWFYDTGRLANIISPVILGWLPHWVFALFSGFAMWITFFYGIKLAGVCEGSVRSYLIVFVLTFALPWLDFAFTVVFALNYVWTGALTVATLYLLFRRQLHTAAATWGAAAVALAAGWMHEGFSIPVLAGMFVWWLWRRRRVSRAQWTVMLAYLTGFIFILVAPAVWTRLDGTYNLFGLLSFNEIILHAVAFCIVPYVFLIVLAVVLIRKELRVKLLGDRQLCGFVAFSATATVVATIMFYVLYVGPRLGWPGTLLATLGLAALLSVVGPVSRMLRMVLSAVMAICVLVNLSGTAVLQYGYLKESENIAELFKESETGEVYYDNLPEKIDVSLFKTSSRSFNEYMPQECFSHYYSDGAKRLQLLPSALKNFTGENLEICRSDSTLFLYKGMLLTRREPEPQTTIRLYTEDFGTVVSRLRTRAYTAADSSRWYLIIPHAVQMYGLRVEDAEMLCR